MAEAFREEARDERRLNITWERLGECFKKLNKPETAKEYGEKALKFFKAEKNPERIKQIKAWLSKIN